MTSFRVEEGLMVLARTPAVCAALLDGLPAAWTQARLRPDAWCPSEVVAHLLYGESTDWIPRARIILEHGDARPFTSFDRAGHQELSRRPLPRLLQDFRDARAANLRTLRDWRLGPDDLQRTGLHPQLGRVTLGNLLATWVVHDLAHMKQMTRAMATRYRDAVGPWNHADYLPILQET